MRRRTQGFLRGAEEISGVVWARTFAPVCGLGTGSVRCALTLRGFSGRPLPCGKREDTKKPAKASRHCLIWMVWRNSLPPSAVWLQAENAGLLAGVEALRNLRTVC